MSSHIASEADINALVKEYLKYKGLEKSVGVFESECSDKGTPIASIDVKPKASQKMASVQTEMLELFDGGRRKKFFQLWSENLPRTDMDVNAQKLEFYLNVYFAIYSRKHGVEDVEEGMVKFRQYLETCGQTLSQTAEFTSYYALPFVPKPESHPSYSNLFTGEWTDGLRRKLDSFLKLALRALPQPRLVDIYHKTVNNGGVNEGSVQKLEQRLLESERKVASCVKKFSRLQSEYHNLITITAGLVDTLEQTVHGDPVSPQYLEDICNKLFSSQVRQTNDFSRPGTAGKLLRQSAAIQPGKNSMDSDREPPGGSALNYAKIKSDLASSTVHYRTRGLLLQALRWKLTKTLVPERDTILAAYISNDLMGCLMPGQYRKSILEMLRSENDNNLLRQYTARLLNTFASLIEGRGYLTKNTELVAALISCLQTDSTDDLTREHVLACLQKLSLRRQLQHEMISKGVIEYVVTLLRDTDSLSDYMLEYATALLMNLCLRQDGQERCVPISKQMLKVLLMFLDNDNKEILPYVNGTLYSILAMPNIRKDARNMGLEETLRCYMDSCTSEMKRQFEYILKELNKPDNEVSNKPVDDDDDDDEEDQDTLEQDLDRNELLKAEHVEFIGDQFLRAHYTTDGIGTQRRKRPIDNVLLADDLLRRPVTPNRKHSNTDFHSDKALPSTRSFGHEPPPPVRRDELHRPPTRSGSRPNSANSVPDAATYRAVSREGTSNRPSQSSGDKAPGDAMTAFNARPKIPRTPDGATRPLSRGSPGDGPPPQPKYSDSLPTPRPGSGSTSQAEKKTLHGTGSNRLGGQSKPR